MPGEAGRAARATAATEAGEKEVLATRTDTEATSKNGGQTLTNIWDLRGKIMLLQ